MECILDVGLYSEIKLKKQTNMVYGKLKHFKVGYMMVKRFVHVVFSFGLAHNFGVNHWFLKNYAA